MGWSRIVGLNQKAHESGLVPMAKTPSPVDNLCRYDEALSGKSFSVVLRHGCSNVPKWRPVSECINVNSIFHISIGQLAQPLLNWWYRVAKVNYHNCVAQLKL